MLVWEDLPHPSHTPAKPALPNVPRDVSAPMPSPLHAARRTSTSRPCVPAAGGEEGHLNGRCGHAAPHRQRHPFLRRRPTVPAPARIASHGRKTFTAVGAAPGQSGTTNHRAGASNLVCFLST